MVAMHKTKRGHKIAYTKTDAKFGDTRPGLIFLPGFKSDMQGGKALFLEDYAKREGLAYIRFDYMAHGQSEGDFMDGTMSIWRDDALEILDHVADYDRPHILIGSSMGGWVGMMVALARPSKVAGFIGIAAAPDFTEDLRFKRMTEEQKEQLEKQGYVEEPSGYDEPYIFTKKLIEDGRTNLLLDKDLEFLCPVELLQGKEDSSVPHQWAERIRGAVKNPQVKITYINDGDHSLSRPDDLLLLQKTVESVLKEQATCSPGKNLKKSNSGPAQ